MLRLLYWLRITRHQSHADAVHLWFGFLTGSQVTASSLGCWGMCWVFWRDCALLRHLNFLMFHQRAVKVLHQDRRIPGPVLWYSLIHALVFYSCKLSHLIFRTVLYSIQFSTLSALQNTFSKTKNTSTKLCTCTLVLYWGSFMGVVCSLIFIVLQR